MRNVILLALAGCSWIGGEGHRADLAVWSVDLEAAEQDCSGTGIVLAASTALDEGQTIEVRATVGGSSQTASATVSGGRLAWDFTELDGTGAASLEVTLTGNLAVRDDSVPLTLVGGGSWYPDTDGDGYGAGEAVQSCSQLEGHVANGDDCDDTDPDAFEVVDGFIDSDGDGFAGTAATACGAVLENTDCDDDNHHAFPGSVEICNGFDDDCNELIDEADPGLIADDGPVDADGDGYVADEPGPTCQDFSALPAGDCDDTNDTVYPGAHEICDMLDNDCDGIDEDDEVPLPPAAAIFFRDHDGDGLGSEERSERVCFAPVGYVTNEDDCDDTDATVGGPTDYWLDQDADGHFAATGYLSLCEPPTEPYATTVGDDCDDFDNTLHPSSPELCDGIDNDCDGLVDDDDTLDIGVAPDVDGDGYWAGSLSSDCDMLDEPTYIVASTEEDCNDNAAAVNPGATEICNGFDDNCDTVVDVGTTGLYDPGSGTVAWADVLHDSDISSVLVCGTNAWSGALSHSLTITAGTTDATLEGRLHATAGNLTVNDVMLQADGVGGDGGVLLLENGITTLNDVVVTCGANVPENGGAIAAIDANRLALNRVELEGCAATGAGGAVYSDGTTVDVRESRFVDNTAAEGGAIWLGGDGASVSTDDATVWQGNVVTGRGGALYFQTGNHSLTAVQGVPTFEFNRAGLVGGAVFSGGGALPDALYVENTAGQGGALYIEHAGSTVTGTFQSNRATVRGGAVALGPQATNQVVGGSFTGNVVGETCSNSTLSQCTGSGGAIVADAGFVVDVGSSFTNNLANNGGAIAAIRSVVITGASFNGNRANTRGGGIYLSDEGTLTASPGTQTSLSFDHNDALEGPAIAIMDAPPVPLGPVATITQADFSNLSGTHFILLADGEMECNACSSSGAPVKNGTGHTFSTSFDGSSDYTCGQGVVVCY